MNVKGYIFFGRIVAIEGADNHPRLIAEASCPLPFESIMGNQMLAKSMAGTTSMDLVRVTSERERGELQPSGKDMDCSAVADLVSGLGAKLRNGEFKSVKLSKVESDSYTFVSLSIERK